ncbi:unnamed protein product [Pleuronectes platessa]|uniref:Uncharacterized protein n=1 Tax=Pleuronectes platessa TaxID=8262 RepID=A0A9N7Y1L1_PLEPL|nr:unnamed protein product [Pleuronectes platessa]
MVWFNASSKLKGPQCRRGSGALITPAGNQHPAELKDPCGRGGGCWGPRPHGQIPAPPTEPPGPAGSSPARPPLIEVQPPVGPSQRGRGKRSVPNNYYVTQSSQPTISVWTASTRGQKGQAWTPPPSEPPHAHRASRGSASRSEGRTSRTRGAAGTAGRSLHSSAGEEGFFLDYTPEQHPDWTNIYVSDSGDQRRRQQSPTGLAEQRIILCGWRTGCRVAWRRG